MSNGIVATYMISSVWNLDIICRDLGISVEKIDKKNTYVERDMLYLRTKNGKWYEDIEPNIQSAPDEVMSEEFKEPGELRYTLLDVDADEIEDDESTCVECGWSVPYKYDHCEECDPMNT